MKKYEIMYIIKPDLGEEKTKKITETLVKSLTSFKSKVVDKKEIGVKELAYEIQKFKKGYYYWMLVEASSEAIKEFNRLVSINENIIRYIVVKEEE